MQTTSPEEDDYPVAHTDAKAYPISSNLPCFPLPLKLLCLRVALCEWIQCNNGAVLRTEECVILPVLSFCHNCWCTAWHAGRACSSSGALSVSFWSYCSGHGSTVMWKASLINSDRLPSRLSLEENKKNQTTFLALHLFTYTSPPPCYICLTLIWWIWCLNAKGQTEGVSSVSEWQIKTKKGDKCNRNKNV